MKADIFGDIRRVMSLVVLLILTGSSAVSAQEPVKAPEGPRLELVETSYDAGLVNAGASVSHEFIVRNTGDQDLHILKVKPGCGCTVVNFSRVIPPGREGRVIMKVYYSNNWSGKSVRQASVIESNDPRSKRVSLAIKAQLQPKETK